MPTYEYECKSCSHNFEVFQSMSDQPLKECPKCGKEIRRLIFGGSGVIFKGSGFYVTDKGGKTETKSAKPKKNDSAAASSAAGNSTAGNGCSQCPAASETGKCPAAAATESKSA